MAPCERGGAFFRVFVPGLAGALQRRTRRTASLFAGAGAAKKKRTKNVLRHRHNNTHCGATTPSRRRRHPAATAVSRKCAASRGARRSGSRSRKLKAHGGWYQDHRFSKRQKNVKSAIGTREQNSGQPSVGVGALKDGCTGVADASARASRCVCRVAQASSHR